MLEFFLNTMQTTGSGYCLPSVLNLWFAWYYFRYTMESRFNDLRYNDIAGITINIRSVAQQKL